MGPDVAIETAGPRRRLQEGIYFRRGTTPPGFFAIVFLRAAKGARAGDVADLVAELWKRYQLLKAGEMPELPELRVPQRGLQVLLGLGPRAFALPGRAPAIRAPSALSTSFSSPGRAPGTSITTDSGIRFEAGAVDLNDAVVALQFTARTATAAERPVVETWKCLFDEARENAGRVALEIAAVYTGAKRDDGRSWIDFHDGLSNLGPGERQGVITIPGRDSETTRQLKNGLYGSFLPEPEDAWTVGGTYLAYMRLYIELAVWHPLKLHLQEILVGRRKISGDPLLSAGREFPNDIPRAADGEPPHEADWRTLDVDVRLSSEIGHSHVQRVNHHLSDDGGWRNPANHRIFRQGYPFLEPTRSASGFRVGLNFVSFQWHPASLIQMLDMGDWLGGTNFGGSMEEHDDVPLLRAQAAGVFVVPQGGFAPPYAGLERFPGEHALLGEELASANGHA